MVQTETTVFPDPTRLILTEEGSSYFFARNQRLQRFRLLDGREDYGLLLSEYSPTVLQKLTFSGLIRKLEFPVPDVVEMRRRVIDHVQIVACSIVYRHAGAVATDIVERSDLFRNWKRENPRSDLSRRDSRRAVETLLKNRAEAYESIRSIVRTRITGRHNALLRETGRNTGGDDRSMTDETINTLIDTIPLDAWFLLIIYRSSKEAAQLVHDLTEAMVEIVRKTVIADYLALVIVELLVHMQHNRGATRSERHDTALYLLSQIQTLQRKSATDHQRIRLHAMISTENIRFDALKSDLADIAEASETGTQTFEQFYRSAGSETDTLGLYYMGFLEDACRRVDVTFESFARGLADDGLMNLVMTM